MKRTGTIAITIEQRPGEYWGKGGAGNSPKFGIKMVDAQKGNNEIGSWRDGSEQ